VPSGTSIEAIRKALHYRSIDRISKALLKGGNRFLPILSARASIPFAALGLKKYLSDTSPVSMTSNNIDSLARLGDSEVLAVKDTPSNSIPEFGQRSNNDLEVSSSVGREETLNVLDENNSGQSFPNEPSKVIKEARLLPSKP